MDSCFSFLKKDLVKIFDVRQVYNDPHALNFIRTNVQKNYLHEITYETDLPKRIELGDAIDENPYHLVIQNVTIGNTTKDYESYPEMLSLAPPIDSLLLKSNSTHDKWNISVSFHDNEATHDFYMFNYSRNGIMQTDTISKIAYASDEYFNGQFLSLERVHRGITDLEYGDTVTEYLSVIPERFYKFLVAANAEAEPDVPLFAGPPANVPGNINNGALGFFNVYSVSKASTIAKHR